MGFDKKSTLIKQVVELYRQGMTQKAIAIQVNVTETTIKEWLKEVKQKNAENKANIKKLEEKLKVMLDNPSTTPADINNITLSIRMLENRFFNK